MVNIVFIIVLFILVFSAINGWRKGLLGIVYGLISWICILAFVILASPSIDRYIRERTSLPETMQQKVEQTVNEKVQKISETAKESQENVWNTLLAEIPESLRDQLENLSDQQTGNQTENPTGGISQEIIEVATQDLLDFAIRGIAVLVAFIFAQLVVWFVGNIVRAVGDAPVVSGINGCLGLVAGAAQGFLYVWILMYLVCMTGVTEFSQKIMTYIFQNPFTTYLYQHNLVMEIIEMF